MNASRFLVRYWPDTDSAIPGIILTLFHLLKSILKFIFLAYFFPLFFLSSYPATWWDKFLDKDTKMQWKTSGPWRSRSSLPQHSFSWHNEPLMRILFKDEKLYFAMSAIFRHSQWILVSLACFQYTLIHLSIYALTLDSLNCSSFVINFGVWCNKLAYPVFLL
jgi:hypothetical protein